MRSCRKPNSVRIIRDFCFSVASVAVHVVHISRRDDLRRGGAFYSQWQVLLRARAPDVYHAVGDLPASLGARRQGRQTQGQISQGECSLHTIIDSRTRVVLGTVQSNTRARGEACLSGKTHSKTLASGCKTLANQPESTTSERPD